MTAPRSDDREAGIAAQDCPHDTVDTFYGPKGSDVPPIWACAACKRRFYPACPECVSVGHRGDPDLAHKVRDAIPAEPSREAAHVWFGGRGAATGGNVPPPRDAIPAEPHTARCVRSGGGDPACPVCTRDDPRRDAIPAEPLDVEAVRDVANRIERWAAQLDPLGGRWKHVAISLRGYRDDLLAALPDAILPGEPEGG